jgi:hypothetical protein
MTRDVLPTRSLLSKPKKLTAVTAIVFALCGYLLLKVNGASDVRQILANAVFLYFLAWGLYSLLANTPRDEIQKRFLLMTAAACIIFVLLEAPAWLRLVNYELVFSDQEPTFWASRGYVVDRELGWIPKPYHHMQGQYTRGEISQYVCGPPGELREYDLRYDRNGFRNETDLRTADIVVVGDSYVEAPMVPSSALLTAVLASLEHTSVANLGMSGYGPQQELAVLKRYALNLQPKVVVWVFFEGNDLENAQAYDGTVRELLLHDPSNPPWWQRSFSRNSLSALARAWRGCVPDRALQKRFGTIMEADGRRWLRYFVSVGRPLSSREWDALEKTRAALAAAYELCRKQDVKFLVAFAPTAFRTYAGLSTLVEASEEVRNAVPNDLPGRMRNLLTGISSDIGFIDLTPAFRSEAEQGRLIFLLDDIHWTPHGHRVVAEALHKTLASPAGPS